MIRCHRCLTRVRPEDCASEDEWGHLVCNDCATCVHYVRLSDDCVACLRLEEELLTGVRELDECVLLV